MNSDNDRKNKKNSNDSTKKMDYDKIFFAVDRLMKLAFRDLTERNLKPGTVYTYGFKIQMTDEGIPRIEKVNNYKNKKSHPLMRFNDSKDEEPVFDFIEYFDTITITTELFGVDKNDIQLSLRGQQLIINIDQAQWKCKETIDLPCAVKSQTIRYTFKNGVLDIEMEKKFLFS